MIRLLARLTGTVIAAAALGFLFLVLLWGLVLIGCQNVPTEPGSAPTATSPTP